jgi:hypothetical protein
VSGRVSSRRHRVSNIWDAALFAFAESELAAVLNMAEPIEAESQS